MIHFVVRCRKTPVDPSQFRASLGRDAHVEFIPAMIINALFVASGHRPDSRLHLVFEKSQDFSRVLSFHGDDLGDLGGLTERALLDSCAVALAAGSSLAKDGMTMAKNGVRVSALSFERLLDELSETLPGYLLDPKGQSLQAIAPVEDGVFVLSDQLVMPKNSRKGLVRKGFLPVSLGKTVLFASQCISVIQGLRGSE